MPTNAALMSKHVLVNATCLWCHRFCETDVHVLFECEFAKMVWANSCLQNTVVPVGGETCFGVLLRVFQNCSKDQCVMVEMLCWSLWNRMNRWVWERVNGSIFGVRAAAVNMLNDWRKACMNEVRGMRMMCSGTRKWQTPPTGWFKINVDATIFPDGWVGLGCVVRDSYGRFLRAKCGRIEGRWQPREAEALGMKEALSWSKQLSLDHCIFESDSKVLVEACKENRGESYFHTIVSDCVQLSKHFEHVQIVFASRSVNKVAHLLATYSLADLREWDENPPEFINHVLFSDLN